jgi:2-oxo-3-hexenedioate decarboxylase
VYCGIEVIDSRYRDFRFTLPDVVADNGSSGCFALRPAGVPAGSLDLALEACLLEVDGQVHDSATGAAVLGHPAAALARRPTTWASAGSLWNPAGSWRPAA